MEGVKAEVDGAQLTLTGPRGTAKLGVRSMREVERTDDALECRDRVGLELTYDTATPDDPDVSPRTVLYVHTHDSYDGAHRDVVEDETVNDKLIEAIATEIGADPDPKAFAAAVATWLPDYAPSVKALLDAWDNRMVPDGYPSGFLD